MIPPRLHVFVYHLPFFTFCLGVLCFYDLLLSGSIFVLSHTWFHFPLITQPQLLTSHLYTPYLSVLLQSLLARSSVLSSGADRLFFQSSSQDLDTKLRCRVVFSFKQNFYSQLAVQHKRGCGTQNMRY